MRILLGGRSAAATLAATAVIVGACATGGGSTEEEDGASSTTSVGGAGGGAGGGATTTTGGSGGVGGTGGTPEMCSEDPCKLTAPQCGCGTDENCNLGADGRECIGAGDKTAGEGCVDGECAVAHQCLGNPSLSAPAMCLEFCDEDTDCSGPGGICVFEIEGAEATVCSINCDPVSGAGCSDGDAKCEIYQEDDGQMRTFTMCVGLGTGTQETSCTDTHDCADGYGCFELTDPNTMTTETLCLHWCDTANGTACPVGSQCSGFTDPLTVGNVTYGACVPTQ